MVSTKDQKKQPSNFIRLLHNQLHNCRDINYYYFFFLYIFKDNNKIAFFMSRCNDRDAMTFGIIVTIILIFPPTIPPPTINNNVWTFYPTGAATYNLFDNTISKTELCQTKKKNK